MAWPSGTVAGLPSTRLDREAIRREEARFVEETIAQAKAAQAVAARRQKTFGRLIFVWFLALFLVPVVWVVVYSRTWNRIGRDYRFPAMPQYVREPPSDLPPALVELLKKEGVGNTPKAFTATIFDLARRGYIEMEDRLVEKRSLFGTKSEYETTMTLKKTLAEDARDGLQPFERDVLELLFPKERAPEVRARG